MDRATWLEKKRAAQDEEIRRDIAEQLRVIEVAMEKGEGAVLFFKHPNGEVLVDMRKRGFHVDTFMNPHGSGWVLTWA